MAAENNLASRCPAARTTHESLNFVSEGPPCCFRGIFPQTLPLGWTLGLFGDMGCARSHATPRHRAVYAIPACYRRPRRLSASNRGQELRRPSVSPGLFLAPGGILPLAPRIRAVYPRPGVFPWPARGWVTLTLSRPGMGPSGGKHVLPAGRPDLSRVKCHHVLADFLVIY